MSWSFGTSKTSKDKEERKQSTLHSWGKENAWPLISLLLLLLKVGENVLWQLCEDLKNEHADMYVCASAVINLAEANRGLFLYSHVWVMILLVPCSHFCWYFLHSRSHLISVECVTSTQEFFIIENLHLEFQHLITLILEPAPNQHLINVMWPHTEICMKWYKLHFLLNYYYSPYIYITFS